MTPSELVDFRPAPERDARLVDLDFERVLGAALAGVASAFASLGRVFFCADASFHVLHASSHLDRLLGPGAARGAEGGPCPTCSASSCSAARARCASCCSRASAARGGARP